jgi:colanic acid/amylovoran biosynthesis glycosyltransferase
MHIAYILKRYPRLSETFIVNEMRELRRQGATLTILAAGDPGEKIVHTKVRELDVPVYYLPDDALFKSVQMQHRSCYAADAQTLDVSRLKGGASSKAYLQALQVVAVAPLLRKLGVEHLHAHFATGASTLAMQLSECTGLHFSFTAHAKDIFHESVDKDELVEKITRASAVVTVTDFNLRHLNGLLRERGLPESVTRIYNGLDLAEFAPDATPREPGLVVGVGRLVEKKGFDTLIAAIARLRADGRAVRCVIIGDGEERASLTQKIAELGLQETVVLAGAQPQEQVIEQLRRASVFALPCCVGEDGNMDALPTVLLEAMALGTPVISTLVNGIPEIITHGEQGLLVPERDPAALAAAIDAVLGNPALCAVLRAGGLHKMRVAFDATRNVAALQGVFESCMRRARQHALCQAVLS